jgi:hypothetical protein
LASRNRVESVTKMRNQKRPVAMSGMNFSLKCRRAIDMTYSTVATVL